MKQETRFCRTPDGVRIAYALCGQGPPLVKASNWLTHIEFEWDSPIWRHWLREQGRDNVLIRYDERANGLSDWDVEEISFQAWVEDLETVVEAAGQQASTEATAAVIFDAILNRRPAAPFLLNPQLPRELARIIDKSLEKEPQQRYQSAAEMDADLGRLKRETERAAAPGFSASRADPRFQDLLRRRNFSQVPALGGVTRGRGL